MVRLLLAMRAGRTQTPDRSGNCSSLATENADGSSYQRTGANRTQGRHDLVRVLPVGGMPPTGNLVAPTLVGNHAGDYYTPKIQGTPVPPVIFVAHMDHPGFEMLGGKRAEFLGGVPREMFAKGVGVRVFSALECSDLSELFVRGKRQSCVKPQHSIERATIARFNASAWPKRKLVELRTDQPLRKGDFGMWDVPAFRVAGDKLHAVAIDD